MIPTTVMLEPWDDLPPSYLAVVCPPADGRIYAAWCTGGPSSCPFTALADACEFWLECQKVSGKIAPKMGAGVLTAKVSKKE